MSELLERLRSEGQLELMGINDKAQIKELQELLIKAGLLREGGIDGIIGLNTASAWRVFKESVWLDKPGIIGVDSFNKLLVAADEASRKIPSHDEPSPKNILIANAIIEGGSFTWQEATHGGTRPAETNEVKRGMIRLATWVQKYRDRIGHPFVVTSWYRPPHINKRVGGARFSRHMSGDAMDFYVPGYSASQIIQEFRDWPGGLGQYASMPNIIHIDARSGKARWGGAPW